MKLPLLPGQLVVLGLLFSRQVVPLRERGSETRGSGQRRGRGPTRPGGQGPPYLSPQDLVNGRAFLQGALGHHLGPHLLHIQHEGIQRLLHVGLLFLLLLHGDWGFPGKAPGGSQHGRMPTPARVSSALERLPHRALSPSVPSLPSLKIPQQLLTKEQGVVGRAGRRAGGGGRALGPRQGLSCGLPGTAGKGGATRVPREDAFPLLASCFWGTPGRGGRPRAGSGSPAAPVKLPCR